MKLNRFSADRQEQLEYFVEYAQLMGLSGKDLVAIGGKIEREQKKERKIANMAVVQEFECLPIGKDSVYQIDDRFKLKTIAGAYNFYYDGWDRYEVLSLKTKVQKVITVHSWDYDLPKTDHRTRARYAVLLDIASGRTKLDF